MGFVSVINWVLMCFAYTHYLIWPTHHPMNAPHSEMSTCGSNGTKMPTVTEPEVARSVLRAGPSQQSQCSLPTHWKSILGVNPLSTQKTLRTKYVLSFSLCGLKFWGSSLYLAHADCSACAMLGSGNRTREMTQPYSFPLRNTKESNGFLSEILFPDPGSI